MPSITTSILLASLISLAGCEVGEALDPASDHDAPTAAGLSPSDLTWPVVRAGETNQNVVVLQYLLRHHGFTVPLTGAFESTTFSQLGDFQRSRGLTGDGIAGNQTWRALVVDVNYGDQDNAVAAVQYLLKNRFGGNISVTGLFLDTTDAVLADVQRSLCLAASGSVGLFTWHALVAESSYCTGSGSDASKVLAAHNRGTIELWDQTFGRLDGADPLSNIRDAAAGRPAKTSCYGNAPCNAVFLSERMLDGLEGLISQHGLGYFVTSIAGANHGPTSFHFSGRAVDFGEVNGTVIFGDSAISRTLMNACRALGAIEVLGPSNDPAGHNDHVHCAW